MKKKNIKGRVFLLVVFFILSILLLVPILSNINFGLDLQGGFEVLYKVNGLDGEKITSDQLTATYKTISKRIDVLGVSEPNIIVEGDDRIRVELAGVTNPDEAREILSKAANLTFRDTNDNLLMNSDVISNAKVGTDELGLPAVALTVKDKDKFYEVTKKISEATDNRIVIWLDFGEDDSFKTEEKNCGSLSTSRCLSAATVSEGFASDVIIKGNFTKEEAESLAQLISSGSLPTKLEEISSKTVTAQFGEDSLMKTFISGVVGIVLIMTLLVCLYRFAGFVASTGIMIYSAFLFFVFWLVGGVLTLPGIAAAVIGIGMAVDSAVISFARIKDELKKGSTLKNAVINGNKNSFMSIFDSNITTLIVAIILFIFGESSVKGFATMLIISIIVTMLVMVFVVRWLINGFVKNEYFENKKKVFINFSEMSKKKSFNFDFMKKGKLSFAVALLVLIVGVTSLVTSGLKLGVDFKGGTSITVRTEEKINLNEVKDYVSSFEYNVYETEEIDNYSAIIKIDNALDKNQVLELENGLNDKYNANTDIGVVSNIVKKELVKNAVISLLLASLGIIIYVTCRFQFSYAVGGIAALVYDVFTIIAIFSLLKLEVSSIFIAAILSIIGYSINDTIVTFDRIRENIANKYKHKIKNKDELNELVNTSLNETVGRSIVTTISTLIPVICLIFLGSHEILNFNLALLVGLISGTYSSIFIACQIFAMLFKNNIGKDLSKKWYDDID